jgi:hypothetical protein
MGDKKGWNLHGFQPFFIYRQRLLAGLEVAA